MTEQQIKELLSRHYVGLVATRAGFKTDPISPDNGTDLSVTRAVIRDRPQGRRIVDDGNVLHVQLKCTCEGNIHHDDDAFKYDLDVTAYNDLVERWMNGNLIRLLLVVVILPDESSTWLTLNEDELILRRAGYWYRPPADATISTNASTVRIRIPKANAISLTLFGDKFAEYYSS